jgi:mannitol-1-/sugar-/sorbitol-6-phosphatase
MTRVPAAILSDLDGVLIDSGDAIERAWRRWAGERGVDSARLEGLMHGRPSVEVVRLVAPGLDAAAEAVRVDDILVEDGEVHALPGARELLAGGHGLPVAVVTSCTETLARARFAALDLPVPEVLITVDRVRRGKPDPEGYRAAAAALDVEPADAVVLEDAPAGLAAARAAGARVVGITTTHRADELDADEHAGSVADWLGRLRAAAAAES